jgi:2,5-diketo-D-gluconate reductase A
MTDTPTTTLSSGYEMPVLGLGTWPMYNHETEKVVAEAVAVGYRLVDTASRYGNETGVGRGIVRSGTDREAIFVTSKLRGGDHGERMVRRAVDAALANLAVDYLDLYLIHWPLPALDQYVESWLALEELAGGGLIRSIGVSNFEIEHLERLLAAGSVRPAVNQVEINPYLPQDELVAFHAEHGIVSQAWAPLGHGGGQLLSEPVLTAIAADVGKTAAQVVLRWHFQRGVCAIPKSSNPARLRQNLDVFDFTLSPEQMRGIGGLANGQRVVESGATHDER